MKHFSLLLFISITLATHAQSFPTPDFANIPLWYDGTNLKSFERLPPNSGTRMTGMVSAEMLIFFAGETSSVQFPSGKVPPFIVKMNSETDDPASSVELGKLQVNKRKHQREYIAGKAGFGNSKTTLSTIMVDFKKVGAGVYQIIPTQALESGEYCFSVGKNGFLFSVVNK
jgi:hypothetical protein